MIEFTETEIIEYIKTALSISKGDNLERAQRSFKGLDLTKQHGQSGKTRGEILDEYKTHRQLYYNALKWVEQHSQE